MDAISTVDTVIAWAGFLGAWLLFAGPVYQAALELREQEIQRADIERMGKGVDPPAPVSPWWWLLPPAKLYLEHRHQNEFQRRIFDVLDAQTVEGLVNYINKATGWLMVATGGFLIAAKETWELVEHEEQWPWWLFFVLAVVMAMLSVLFVAGRIYGGQKMVESKRTGSSGAGPGLPGASGAGSGGTPEPR